MPAAAHLLWYFRLDNSAVCSCWWKLPKFRAHHREWVLFLPFVPGCTIIETNTAQKKAKSSLAEPWSIRRDSHCGFEHLFCGYMIVLTDTCKTPISAKISSSHASLKVALACCFTRSRRILIQAFVFSTISFVMLWPSKSFK